MKKLLFLFIFLNTTIMFAQEQTNWCGTDAIREQMRAKYPDYDQQIAKFERQISDYLANKPQANNRAIVTIPVVVHIVHHDHAILNSITEAQVQSQIDVLNRDFAQLNSDISYLPTVFTSRCSQVSEIRFCLARQNPAGLYTTGIEKKITTAQGFDKSQDGNPNLSVKSTVLGLEAWNTDLYLNVWVCNLIGPDAYAYVPPIALGDEWRDGIVVNFGNFGALPLAERHVSRNMGRPLVHEAGHYLGLLHLPGEGETPDCGDDFCDDTPLQKAINSWKPVFPKYNSDPGGANVCSYPTCPNVCGEGNMFMNIMDITDDKIRLAFTNDQKYRMEAVLAIERPALSVSNGCVPGDKAIFLQKARGGIPANSAYISDISTNQATIHWLHWVSNSYQVRIKKTTDSAFPSFGAAQTDNFKTVTALNAGTTYNVEIRHNLPNGTAKIVTTSFTTNAINAPSPTVPDASNYYIDALPLTLSGSTTTINNHTIGFSGDEDWFKFSPPGSQPNIKITLKNLPLDYDLKVFAVEPTDLNLPLNFPFNPLNPFTIPDIFTFSSASSQLYYVYVTSYHGDFDANKSYQLVIETSSAPFGKTENPSNSISEQSNSDLFSVYPNPIHNGYFNLNITSEIEEYGKVQIANVLGQILYRKEYKIIQGNNDINIDVSSFAKGTYVIHYWGTKQAKSKSIAIF